MGQFPSTCPLTACEGCIRDRKWQNLQVAQSKEWIARCVSIIRRTVLDVMSLMGVSLGKFSICSGYRKAIDTFVRLVRWGDDFSLIVRRSLCNTFRDHLGKHLLVKTTAVLGPKCGDGRCAGSNPPEPVWKGVKAMGARGRPSTR